MNFVTINKKSKTFKSALSKYKYVPKIASKASETIIVDSRSENIHPFMWDYSWFEDIEDARNYLSKLGLK
jgi:hypothetical protein